MNMNTGETMSERVNLAGNKTNNCANYELFIMDIPPYIAMRTQKSENIFINKETSKLLLMNKISGLYSHFCFSDALTFSNFFLLLFFNNSFIHDLLYLILFRLGRLLSGCNYLASKTDC